MTDFFLRLLGARIEDAVNIKNAALTFHGGLSTAWVVLLAVLLAAFAWWTYRKSPQTLSPVRQYTLATLRILFLLLLLGLFLRPVLAFTVEGSIRRLLVVLLDDSASMQISDQIGRAHV